MRSLVLALVGSTALLACEAEPEAGPFMQLGDSMEFTCDDGTPLSATVYLLEPDGSPNAIVTRGLRSEPFDGYVAHVTWDGRQQLALLAPTASGAQYVADGLSFWTKAGEAMLDVEDDSTRYCVSAERAAEDERARAAS